MTRCLLRIGWILPLSLALLALPAPSAAAVPDVTLHLRPHCETAPAASPCPAFTAYDQETLVTQGLKPGDILDLDIVLGNPSLQGIQSVQSWLAYDAAVLKGLEIRVADTFPLIAPGEQTFAEQGSGGATNPALAKIGASNVSGGLRGAEAVFARVRFQVLAARAEPVFLRFHEFALLGEEGKTKVLLVEEGRTVNVLKNRPKDLLLFFGAGTPPTKLPSSPVHPPTAILPPVSSSPSVPALPQPVLPDDGFSRLQPSGLRAATDGDRVFLLWNLLSDPRVRGYNLSYGTVSGRYIQRRSVSAGTAGATVKGLPQGTRYFFAVTAFDVSQRETAFSSEVSVITGDPASSTSPFTATDFGRAGGAPVSPPGGTAREGQIAGGTGLPSIAIVLSALAAFGGALVFRLRS